MKICDMCLMRDELNPSCVELEIQHNHFHLCTQHQQEVMDFINEKPKKRGRPRKNSGTVSNQVDSQQPN